MQILTGPTFAIGYTSGPDHRHPFDSSTDDDDDDDWNKGGKGGGGFGRGRGVYV
jgi:hypothetical protein